MKSLRAYMGYSRASGSREGAVLVFAHSVREARILTYKNGLVVDDYLDTAARLLRDAPWLFKEADQELLDDGTAHVIECPCSCIGCGQWGEELINGYCQGCIDNKTFTQTIFPDRGDGMFW